MRARSTAGLGVVAAVVVLALTACNPVVSHPAAARSGGVSRSGRIVYAGDASGWLEVQVRSTADANVSVQAGGRDATRDDDGFDDDWCYFSTAEVPAWSGGSSLGYQRLERIGPGTELGLTFTAPSEGLTFDARVVDDGGNVVGDLTHDIPTQGFEAVWGAICSH